MITQLSKLDKHLYISERKAQKEPVQKNTRAATTSHNANPPEPTLPRPHWWHHAQNIVINVTKLT